MSFIQLDHAVAGRFFPDWRRFSLFRLLNFKSSASPASPSLPAFKDETKTNEKQKVAEWNTQISELYYSLAADFEDKDIRTIKNAFKFKVNEIKIQWTVGAEDQTDINGFNAKVGQINSEMAKILEAIEHQNVIQLHPEEWSASMKTKPMQNVEQFLHEGIQSQAATKTLISHLLSFVPKKRTKISTERFKYVGSLFPTEKKLPITDLNQAADALQMNLNAIISYLDSLEAMRKKVFDNILSQKGTEVSKQGKGSNVK